MPPKTRPMACDQGPMAYFARASPALGLLPRTSGDEQKEVLHVVLQSGRAGSGRHAD
jgi:hypothetical protein